MGQAFAVLFNFIGVALVYCSNSIERTRRENAARRESSSNIFKILINR
jgi:hypothetical protein